MPYELRKVTRTGWKVFDSDNRPYSKKNLSKKRATEQLKALYAKDSSMDKKGSGFFADVMDKVKRIGRATASAVRSIPSIRRNYPPSARQVLTEYGDGVITGLTLRREPIMNIINKVINYITNNQWDRAKKQANYDDLYHLGLVITIQKGGVTKNILIEKNEVVNVSTEFSQSSKVQLFVLPTPSQPITLQQLLDKGQQAMGDKFFLYDAFNNNCQAFIAGILRANGMLTADAEAFIVQPVQKLLKGLPRYTPLVARAITDLASLGNRIILGEGACCSACSVGKSCKSASGKHEIATRGFILRPMLVRSGESDEESDEEAEAEAEAEEMKEDLHRVKRQYVRKQVAKQAEQKKKAVKALKKRDEAEMEGGSNLQKLADMNRAMKRELIFAENTLINKRNEILKKERDTRQKNVEGRQEYQQILEAYDKMKQDLRTKTYPEIQEEVQDDPFDNKQSGVVKVAEKGSLRRGQGKGKKKPKENPYALVGVRKKTRGSLTPLARAVQERTASLQAFRGIRDDVKDLQEILVEIQQSYANPVIEGEPNQEDVSIQSLRRRFAERQTELKAEHQRAQQKLNELADEVAIQNREDYASGQRQAYQKEQAKKTQKGNGKPKKKKGGMNDPKDQEGKREPRRPPRIQIPTRAEQLAREREQRPVPPPPSPQPAPPAPSDQSNSPPPAKRQRRGEGKKPKSQNNHHNSMTKPSLIALIKSKGLRGYSKLNKPKLIEMLMDAQHPNTI